MKYSILASAIVAAFVLTACEKTVVQPVPSSSPPVVVPAPVAVPGPPGAPGAPGPEGAPGKSGSSSTVVIIPPAEPEKK